MTDWTDDLPSTDDYRTESGAVDWEKWRKAAVRKIDEIVRREGEQPPTQSSGPG